MSLGLMGLFLALAGCEQVEPGASGTITLDPTIDVSDAHTLRITAVEDQFGGDAPLADAVVPSRRISTEVDLDVVDFPHDYTVGGGIGDASPFETWYVVARLVNEDGEDATADGLEFIGTADFRVPSDSCRGDFCGVAIGIDVRIEPRAIRN